MQKTDIKSPTQADLSGAPARSTPLQARRSQSTVVVVGF